MKREVTWGKHHGNEASKFSLVVYKTFFICGVRGVEFWGHTQRLSGRQAQEIKKDAGNWTGVHTGWPGTRQIPYLYAIALVSYNILLI